MTERRLTPEAWAALMQRADPAAANFGRSAAIEVAEQIAADSSCAQGEFHERVKAIIPYLRALDR